MYVYDTVIVHLYFKFGDVDSCSWCSNCYVLLDLIQIADL